MQFTTPVSIQWLASFIGAELVGETSGMVTGINEIHKVEPGDVVFVDHPKYYDKCLHSAATYIIINKKTDVPRGKALLVHAQPFEAYQQIVRHFRPFVKATGLISETARIREGSYIAPGVFIGNHVEVGINCFIHPNVTILDHCIIGDNVIIQSGTVIGSDAFYYNSKKDRAVWYKKMESCGRVIIGNDAEIGASCTIDRGVSHDTVIGEGSKLDNQVHIGHDTVIGRNCLIAAQVGIAGAVTLKDGVILWGQVGVSKTLTIGENAVIMAQSGVPGDVEGGKAYWGSPITLAKEKMRELVWVKRLPELWDRVMNKK